MTDLIDRRKALDGLEYEMKYGAEIDRCGLDTAYDIIENLPSVEPEPKWIPVTKALPWNDTNVLVTVRDDSGDTPLEYTSVGWRTPDGQYWIVDLEICYGVIAWMPLPEPWRGEE